MNPTIVISALVTTILALAGVIVKLALHCKSLTERIDDLHEDYADELAEARRDHLADVVRIAQSGAKLANLLEPPGSESKI
jgi:hypothetical protein